MYMCIFKYICMCIYVYISCTPVSYTSWCPSFELSWVSRSQGNRTGHCTPDAASQVLGRKNHHFPWPTGSILVNKALSVTCGITPRTYSWIMSRLLSTGTPKPQIYCVVSQLITRNDGWDYPNQTGFCFCPHWTWCSCQPVSSASGLENPSE